MFLRVYRQTRGHKLFADSGCEHDFLPTADSGRGYGYLKQVLQVDFTCCHLYSRCRPHKNVMSRLLAR